MDGVGDVVTVEQQERRGRNPNPSGGCRARVPSPTYHQYSRRQLLLFIHVIVRHIRAQGQV